MPTYQVMNLVQPIIWVLLFCQLFKSVVTIPGFNGGANYLVFLTPGIVTMMALVGSAWAGTAYIQDMERGVMDSFLTSPTSRGAMIGPPCRTRWCWVLSGWPAQGSTADGWVSPASSVSLCCWRSCWPPFPMP